MGNPQNVFQRPPFWQTNRAAAICLSIVLAILFGYLLFQPETFQELRDGFLLGIIPLVTVGGMLACSISMIFDRKSGEPFHAGAGEYRLSWSIVALVVAVLTSVYVYYRLVLALGYTLSTLFYLPALMFLLGIRTPRVLALATFVITAFVFSAFAILGFDLPGGWFGW